MVRPQLDPTAFIAQGAVVAGNVSLGKESSIWYNTVVRGDMAPVRIGDQTNIQDLSIVHVDEGMPCIIGHRVSVGHRVILQGCTVDDECLIGMGAILLNGVHLGTGSVVGAGVRPELWLSGRYYRRLPFLSEPGKFRPFASAKLAERRLGDTLNLV